MVIYDYGMQVIEYTPREEMTSWPLQILGVEFHKSIMVSNSPSRRCEPDLEG